MKKKHFFQFFMGIAIIIVINILSSSFYTRLDLTEDQRFSITSSTKRILKNLPDEVFINVYLDGKLRTDFKRLQNAIKETLDEFKIYAGTKIRYRFADPNDYSDNKKERNRYMSKLARLIPPTQIFDKNEKGEQVKKVIFPGALITYKNDSLPVLLFKTLDQRLQEQGARSPQTILNESVENVEYNLISAIRSITKIERKKVGFLEGHGELSNIELSSVLNKLAEIYDIYKVDLKKEEKITGLDAIVIAKPDSTFSDENKYKIDQFIMNGGKALFFLDKNGIYMDSVMRHSGSFAFPIKHNLLDMMFHYGIRFNSKFIQQPNTLQYSGSIPMVVGQIADKQPKIEPVPWQYYPLLNKFHPSHPIVKGLDAIEAKFIGTIDTVKVEGNVKKTPLLFSNKYSRTTSSTKQIKFDEASIPPNPKMFNEGSLPVAYLLEGEFYSLWRNRMLKSDKRFKTFKAKSPPTSILVCSDGDILKNEIRKKSGRDVPVPLGYNPFFNTTFSNLDFVVNAIDYMIDANGVIAARKKEVKLRPLDEYKVKGARTFWQIFNIVTPILLILAFGIIWFLIRKMQYAKK